MKKIGLLLVVMSTSSCMVSMQRGLQGSANNALEQGARSLACMAKRLYTNDQKRDLPEVLKFEESSDFMKKYSTVDPVVKSSALLVVGNVLKILNHERQSCDEFAQVIEAGYRIENMGERYVLQFEDLIADYLGQSVFKDREKLQKFCLSDLAHSADVAFFFAFAANMSNYSLMNQLLKTQKIEVGYIDDTFSKAVTNEDYKLVNYLLETGLISDYAIGRSFEEVASRGNDPYVEMLLETGKVSSSNVARAFVQASGKGNHQLADRFFLMIESDEGAIAAAFEQAGKVGDFSLMDKLLLTGKIVPATVIDLFVHAVVQDHYELIYYLFKTKMVSESCLKDLARQAALEDEEKYQYVLQYLQSRV